MFRRLLTTMAESAPKRLKTAAAAGAAGTGPLIGTHNGHFHADEALAVHMLRQLPAYADARLVRTRDPKVLETCHTVVDVGGEYDAARNRYDHHQRGFTTTFPGRDTKLSSAGLVFLHFGRAIIAQRLSAQKQKQTQEGGEDKPAAAAPVAEDSPEVELLHRKLYEGFIEALDAHDNGISVYSVKVRVHAHRMLLLCRLFMRLDNVVVRIRDTRVYVDFNTDEVLREYTEKESKFEDVKRVRTPPAQAISLPSAPGHRFGFLLRRVC